MGFSSRRRPASVCLLLFMAGFVPANAAQEPEKPHRQRFSSRQAQDALAESEHNVRLQANPQDQDALRERGLARLRLGRLEEGMADLTQAASLPAASADSSAALAYAYLTLERLPEAAEAAQAALAKDPKHAGAHFYLGRILKARGETREAIEHLEKAAERNPEDADIQFELFAAYRDMSDTNRSARQLGLLKMLLPQNHPGFLYAEGLLQADLGNLEAAVVRFRRALAADPRLASVRQDLGVALVHAERWPESLEVLAPLAESQPQSFAAAYFHALALQNSQRGPEAEGEARRALALRPDSADAHALLGIILAGRGEHSQALQALTRAAQLDAKNFDAQFYLGRLLVKEGRVEEGIGRLQESVALAPQSPEAHYQLGLALRRAGRSAEAQREFATVDRLNRERRSASSGMGEKPEEKP